MYIRTPPSPKTCHPSTDQFPSRSVSVLVRHSAARFRGHSAPLEHRPPNSKEQDHVRDLSAVLRRNLSAATFCLQVLMSPTPMEDLARERIRELTAEADQARLVAEARLAVRDTRRDRLRRWIMRCVALGRILRPKHQVVACEEISSGLEIPCGHRSRSWTDLSGVSEEIGVPSHRKRHDHMNY